MTSRNALASGFCWFLLHEPGTQSLIAEQRKRVVDVVVYRPAGGAGPHKSRRLRLGGKQTPILCGDRRARALTLQIKSPAKHKCRLKSALGSALRGGRKCANAGIPVVLIRNAG